MIVIEYLHLCSNVSIVYFDLSCQFELNDKSFATVYAQLEIYTDVMRREIMV